MNKYLLNLYKQFCDAMGLTFNPYEIQKFYKEFIEWIVINKRLIDDYEQFLNSLGYFNEKTITEVGKGKYDSFKTIKTCIVSPYAQTLGLENSELFMVGNFPMIQTSESIIKPNTDIILTHNPYIEMQIRNWIKIHESKLHDISIGVYGNIHDEDFTEKIKLIEYISNKMNDEQSVDYETDKDNYFCSVNSRRKTKIKILVK